MRLPVYSGQFKRDVKAAEKRGKDMAKLRADGIQEQPLPAASLDHPLKGSWRTFRDAHIEDACGIRGDPARHSEEFPPGFPI